MLVPAVHGGRERRCYTFIRKQQENDHIRVRDSSCLIVVGDNEIRGSKSSLIPSSGMS